MVYVSGTDCQIAEKLKYITLYKATCRSKNMSKVITTCVNSRVVKNRKHENTIYIFKQLSEFISHIFISTSSSLYTNKYSSGKHFVLTQGWLEVGPVSFDIGPTSVQHWANVWCLQGHICIIKQFNTIWVGEINICSKNAMKSSIWCVYIKEKYIHVGVQFLYRCLGLTPAQQYTAY